MINKIISDRLILNQLSEDDDQFILELLNTDGWIRYIGNRNINSKEDAVLYIKKINNNENITYWTVRLKEIENAIGLVTLIKRDYLEYNDVGFAFLPQYFNNGYALEASKAVLNYLIAHNKITHILAETLPENHTSIKLIEKLGLKFEKEMVVDNEILHIFKASIDQIYK